jgi:hypothetical protein
MNYAPFQKDGWIINLCSDNSIKIIEGQWWQCYQNSIRSYKPTPNSKTNCCHQMLQQKVNILVSVGTTFQIVTIYKRIQSI